MAAIKIPVAALVLLCGIFISSWDRDKSPSNNVFMNRFYRRRSRRGLNSTKSY